MPIDYREKRNFRRMTIDCPVTVTRLDTQQKLHGQARDLSANGILFIVSEMLDENTPVEIKLEPQNTLTPPLNARGEVRQVRSNSPTEYEVAVEILEILP